MTKEAALKAFFKRFEGEQVRQGIDGEEAVTWRSFPNTAVKAGTPLPYLSYNIPIDRYRGEAVSGTLQLWDYSSQESPINEKAREIGDAIADGAIIHCDGGYIRLTLGSPECNHTTGEDDTNMKVWQMNVTAKYYTN